MRRGFTLIELIFVIVIIGLLSAVAVPKFLHLKQNAEASNIVKVTKDSAQQALEAAINYRDMEDKIFKNGDYNLSTLIKLNGKGWSWTGENIVDYNVTDGTNTYNVSEINLSGTEVNYSINCKAFNDAGQTNTYNKCYKLLGDKNTTGTVILKY